jgi:tetratricopeptide (TPR) repeat protein
MPLRFGFALAALLAFALPAFAQHGPPANAPRMDLTSDEWREDLRFLANHLREIHPALYRAHPREEFDRAVADLDAAIPSMERHEIVVGLLGIVALARDGHTSMGFGFFGPGFVQEGVDPALGVHRIPVRFYVFEDGLHVFAAASEHAALAGGRVLRVGSVDAEAAYAAAVRLAPADNEYAERDKVASLLSFPEVLHALGLSESVDRVEIEVETADGRRTAVLKAMAPDAPIAWVDAAAGAEMPLYLRNPGRSYWAEYLPESRTLYIQYNSVQNEESESIADFFHRQLGRAAEVPVDRTVIDLRFNQGGNNELNWPIVYELIRSDSINQPGRLFVVTGRRTFSAAQNAANWLEKHTRATFVGEPTGETPNGYGDPRGFALPNSGIFFGVSTLFWQNDPRDDRPFTPPQIYAPLTAADYATGRDPAMEAILSYRGGGGVTAAIAEIRRLHAEPANRFVALEGAVNDLGYRVLRDGNVEGAIEIFRLNAELYPQSANAWDSLAEATWRAGRMEEAVELYQRAIALDPNGFVGGNARAMLARIEAGQPPP